MAKPNKVTMTLCVQEQNTDWLMDLRNVIGVGTGYRIKGGKMTGEVCVQVFVEKKMPSASLAARETVPKTIEGEDFKARTDVLEVRLDANQDTGRYRPVPAGCSIGPESTVSAGTLGGWACDNTDDTTVLLSNNHVISNLDTMPVLRRIVQPSRLDGGVLPGDVIGQLKRDATVNTVPNTAGAVPPLSVVDAAIGTIDVEWTADLRQLGVPVIYEIQAPALGVNVQKRGRTTRLTTNGRITTINTTITITYRNRTRLGRVQNSFIITSTDGNQFSDAGDSGSLILNQAQGELQGTLPVLGLLYGDGTNMFGTPITVANDINSVFGALNLTTICNCVARAVIRAVFGSERLESSMTLSPWWIGGSDMLIHKERQLRRLREQIRRSGPFGKTLDHLIQTESARVGKVLSEDEEAFGLLVRAVRPLVSKSTNYDILETPLDREILENMIRFSSRVSQRSKPLRSKLAFTKTIASKIEGATLGKILRSTELSQILRRKKGRSK